MSGPTPVFPHHLLCRCPGLSAVECPLVTLLISIRSSLGYINCSASRIEAVRPVRRITSIAAGLNHNAAMSVAGEIYLWGSNKHGCLGLGDTSDRALPTKVQSWVFSLNSLQSLLAWLHACHSKLMKCFHMPRDCCFAIPA